MDHSLKVIESLLQVALKQRHILHCGELQKQL